MLGYFRRNRKRMNYAGAVERGLPIGSGVVEAARKNAGHRADEAIRDALAGGWRASNPDASRNGRKSDRFRRGVVRSNRFMAGPPDSSV